METIRIDLSGPEPAYRQIADSLRAALVSTEGPAAGERLPPVRQLAIDLGVHHNTVAQAYRILAEEGWLELVRGRGARVRSRAVPKPPRAIAERFARRLSALVGEALGAGISRSTLGRELEREARRIREEGAEDA